MPALVKRNVTFDDLQVDGSALYFQDVDTESLSSIWSEHSNVISSERLQKFWSELSPKSRRALLKIDKQSFFEQARKNMYCSRCNGLLLEGFAQILLYWKSFNQENQGHKTRGLTNGEDMELVADENPSVHPWGGLMTTRDGALTLMDCYVYGNPTMLENVFDCARQREHDRELQFPDACGGGGRGWISHGLNNYGRVHGTRETCALHTARVSCDTLVEFFKSLDDTSQLNLLQMKEDDFIEKLMYRFDSKRFCRDCRRNVIREFKDLKELKRMRREIHCTIWFCSADAAFQYEVSDDMVQADWRQLFTDTGGTYHHFEWGIGTGEGKSDILDFEDVGMTAEVQVDGLDLGDLEACFITLRAWRIDGRCTELAVKAHALKGQPCVHRRLVVAEGYVIMTKGESIRNFFEHAEEAEEEEDDDTIDKDGNDLDNDGSRPQKHAKSPELAREFLLDAAIVIFKDQVEKAFRENIARQNAHSTFVCLALKLLERNVHLACKDLLTIEKQMMLLREEENEKREDEERKERRRTKERERKLRKKERFKGKVKEKERKDSSESSELSIDVHEEPPNFIDVHEEPPIFIDARDSYREERERALARPHSPDIINKNSGKTVGSECQDLEIFRFGHPDHDIVELKSQGANDSSVPEQSKSSRRKLGFKQDSAFQSNDYDHCQLSFDVDTRNQNDIAGMRGNVYSTSSRCLNGLNRNLRGNIPRIPTRNCNMKIGDNPLKKQTLHDGYDYHSCIYSHQDNVSKNVPYNSRSGWEVKNLNKAQTTLDASRQMYSSGRYNHGYTDSSIVFKGKAGTAGRYLGTKVGFHTKKVWEPTDPRKKCFKIVSDNDLSLQIDSSEHSKDTMVSKGCSKHQSTPLECSDICLSDVCGDVTKTVISNHDICMDIPNNSTATKNFSSDEFDKKTPQYYSKGVGEDEVKSCSAIPLPANNGCDTLLTSSSYDNCSSSLSENSSFSSSGLQNPESASASDSEDIIQQSDRITISKCNDTVPCLSQDSGISNKNTDGLTSNSNESTMELPVSKCTDVDFTNSSLAQNVCVLDVSQCGYETVPRQQDMIPVHANSFHTAYFPAPSMPYHDQGQASWSAMATNGLISFSQPPQYIYPSPLGYGLPANQSPEFCIPYSGLQPLAAAVLNVSQPSMHLAVNHVNVKPDEQMKDITMSGDCKTNDMCNSWTIDTDEALVLQRQSSPKPLPSTADNDVSAKTGKLHETSFSLFHYGGPMASDYSIDSSYLKNISSQEQTKISSIDEKTMEEYNLFSSGFPIIMVDMPK